LLRYVFHPKDKTKKKKAQKDKRTKARNKAVQGVTAKSDNLDKMKKVFNDVKEYLETAETILEKIADRAKKEAEKKVQRWQEKRNKFRSATIKLTSAKNSTDKQRGSYASTTTLFSDWI
jgi:ElaB/YqjD/DUF883 family membrane-anchored ribosome-binding protein